MTVFASLNDGKTTARIDVALEIRGDVLCLSDRHGGRIVDWPLGEIRRAGHGQARPLRFKKAGTDARITLGEDDDGKWLTQKCPNLREPESGRISGRAIGVAGVLAVLSILGILFFLIPNVASWVVRLVPPAVETRIGEAYARQLLELAERTGPDRIATICRSPAAEKILQRRADELAALMESPFPITITVVRFPVANALTFPGGHIVIFSALLEKAESGDEVIGVLAHEIAHVVRRDPLQVAVKRTGAALLVSLLVGDFTGGAALAAGTSALLESGYSRDAEAASDAFAVTALNQLGLSAHPLADFLTRIQKASPGTDIIPGFLSTHPGTAARADTIRRLAQGAGRAMTLFDWRTVRGMCGNDG